MACGSMMAVATIRVTSGANPMTSPLTAVARTSVRLPGPVNAAVVTSFVTAAVLTVSRPPTRAGASVGVVSLAQPGRVHPVSM